MNRVPGWLHLAELPNGRFRAEHLKNREGDETYKPFSEVFSRFDGERLAQSSASRNAQDQQKDGPPRMKTTVLNDPSSDGEGPVGKVDIKHSNMAMNSERQTSKLPERASSRRETSGMTSLPSVDEGTIINADTNNIESVRTSGRQKAYQEKDLRKRDVSTCPVSSSKSPRWKNGGRTRTSESASIPVIAVDTSDSQGDGRSSGSDASSDKRLSGGKISAREKIEGLHSLLNALEDVAKHPNNISKHDEAR